MHTLDLDEHKKQDRENARRILATEFVLMTSHMYRRREYREYKNTFSKLREDNGLSYYIQLYQI